MVECKLLLPQQLPPMPDLLLLHQRLEPMHPLVLFQAHRQCQHPLPHPTWDSLLVRQDQHQLYLLQALLLHAAIYAGVPAVNGAFAMVREVLGDQPDKDMST